MNSRLFIYAAVMGLGVFISAISQVLLKKAAMKKYESVILEYLNFRVVFAYTLFFVSTFLSIYAYKVVPLSMGPIIEATGYIYVTIFGVVIFKEKVSWLKIVALICIILGIAIYSI